MSRRRKKLESGDGWTFVPASEESSPVSESNSQPEAKLSLERRRGKPVTVIQLEGLEADRAKELGKALKTKAAAGGKVSAEIVEIQGDHREMVREYLNNEGLKVKG